jgi:hypothetical protein
MSFYWDALIPNFDISLICVHRDFILFSSNGRNSCTSCFTNNLTIPTCSTNNFFISIHIMTQKVHNMYYDFISIQIMRYISYIYDWISTILLFANYIRHFFPHIPVGILHQYWCWVSAWTLMLHPSLVHHLMECTHISLCSRKKNWEGRYYLHTWAKIILFNCNFMDWSLWVSTYST